VLGIILGLVFRASEPTASNRTSVHLARSSCSLPRCRCRCHCRVRYWLWVVVAVREAGDGSATVPCNFGEFNFSTLAYGGATFTGISGDLNTSSIRLCGQVIAQDLSPGCQEQTETPTCMVCAYSSDASNFDCPSYYHTDNPETDIPMELRRRHKSLSGRYIHHLHRGWRMPCTPQLSLWSRPDFQNTSSDLYSQITVRVL